MRELTGTIYLPNGKLFINPNAQVAEQSAYTAIVSYQLELTEGPELVLNSDYGSTKVPVPGWYQGLKPGHAWSSRPSCRGRMRQSG